MASERRTIHERVGVALSMGNLRQTSGQIDVIGALGAVGITEKLADAVFRLKYSNDPASYQDAMEGVYGIARSLDLRYNWRYHRRRLWWMSKRVLGYWITDLCPSCNGLGYEVMLGTPHLSDRPCRSCHGTRKRAMPWIKRLPRRPSPSKGRGRMDRWKRGRQRLQIYIGRHREILVALERSEQVIGEKMIAKLGQMVRTL